VRPLEDNKYLAIHDSYVVKSNDLIQKSRFKLSLQQQKVVLYLCSMIKPEDEDFRKYTIPIREFCQMCSIDGVGGRQYKAIETTLEQLRQKSYIIRLNKNLSTSVSWVSKWYLDTSASVRSVIIQLDPDMKPYLLRLKSNYTKYEYAYTLRMTHKATPRLYELLKSYHYDKLKPYDKSFDVDELRAILDATDKDSYKQFRYFRYVVLEPAIKEINEQTDISVSLTTRKQGRTVVEVTFHIESKPGVEALDAVGQTYQAFGYNIVGSSVKDKPAQQPERETIQIAACSVKEAKPKIKPVEKPFAVKKEAAEQLPIPMDKPKRESKGKRYQVRIFARGTKTLLKTFSKYSVEEVVSAANEWLHSNGYPQIDKFTGSSLRWEV